MMRDVAICGTGYSDIGRAIDRTVGSLTLDACRAALNEAGLTPKDVDGMATYPAATPVLRPDQPWEQTGDSPCAMVFSDGSIGSKISSAGCPRGSRP